MKRLSPSSSSCSSSSSSSFLDGSDNINHPDHHHHHHHQQQQEQQVKPKIKRSRKNQNKDGKCNSPNSSNSRRSSIYRGVTRHRWTGRFEAHLWDKSSWNNIQNKKGRQVYLGAYDCEEAAARTYDLAALKYWGPETTLNFPIEKYKKEVEEMQKVSKEEYLASLRRRSSGFSRGVSKYRGVARHHHNGRWEARIGRVFGNKYLYLGTYNTQEEAAAAYDMAAIEYRGANAVTNFDISHYIDRLKKKGIINLDKHQISTDQSEETEAEAEVVEQPQPPEQPTPTPPPPQQQQKELLVSPHQLQYTQLPPCMDVAAACTMVVMDPIDDHELTWSFCLDNPGLTPFPVPDFPLENAGELPDLFDDTGFEDNIDFMFDTVAAVSVSNENETDATTTTTNRECVLDNTSCGVHVGAPGNVEDNTEKVTLLSSSSSSSPSSSTTTSVSCNY